MHLNNGGEYNSLDFSLKPVPFDSKAAQFILDNMSKTANGAVNIPIPNGFPARVILPDGTFKAATHIRLIPGGAGVKTAYPVIP